MPRRSRLFILSIVALVALATLPAPAAAQEVRTGGTIVVEEGETIDGDLTAMAGTLIVRGTVEGQLTAFAGNVLIPGTVEGGVSAFAGNVNINGSVAGQVDAFGGNLFVERGAEIGGSLSGAAGNIVVNGAVGGDARLGADTIRLGPAARVAGDLEYDGNLISAEGAQVGGQIQQGDLQFRGPVVPGWIMSVYGFLVNLLLGAVLLAVFPAFTDRAADRTVDDPAVAGGVGLLALIAVPIVLFVVAITIIGIPLALLGALVFGLAIWVSAILGAFIVGRWLLSLTDSRNRWLALLVGLLAVALLSPIPVLGGLVQFIVVLLGLGALVIGLRRRSSGRREARERRPAPRPADEEREPGPTP